MNFKINKINKSDKIPVYKQIYLNIISQISAGEFANMTKLPPERDLAKELNVSRGTIKKAYEHLINNGYAYAEQGSGTFIISESETNGYKKDIDMMIESLSERDFSMEEIQAIFNLSILNKKNKENKNINVAVVDCNPETLKIIRSQLLSFKNINCMTFLLNNVLNQKNSVEVFSDFQIIITTKTHFKILKRHMGEELSDRLVEIVMSIDRETILKIAEVKNINEVGVITNSKRFAKIINNNLVDMNRIAPKENFVSVFELDETEFSVFDTENFNSFVSNKTCLIIPPIYAIDADSDFIHGINEMVFYNAKEVTIIMFNYVMERGSLIFIKQRISECF